LQGHRWWWWNDVLQDIGGRSITGSCARLEPESCRFCQTNEKGGIFPHPTKRKGVGTSKGENKVGQSTEGYNCEEVESKSLATMMA